MCYRPIKLYNLDTYSIFNPKRPQTDERGTYLEVPCGKCRQCRDSDAKQLAIRLHAERISALASFMVTLTYNNEHLPPLGVNSEDVNMFLNRFRQLLFRRYKRRINLRYYYVGEYGYQKKRPHYHMIIFFEDTFIPVHTIYNLINQTWQNGFINVKQLVNTATTDNIEEKGFINDDKGFNYITQYVRFGDLNITPSLNTKQLEEFPLPNVYDRKYYRTSNNSEYAALCTKLNEFAPRFFTSEFYRLPNINDYSLKITRHINEKCTITKTLSPYDAFVLNKEVTNKERYTFINHLYKHIRKVIHTYDWTLRFQYRKYLRDIQRYYFEKQNPPFRRFSKGLGLSLFTNKNFFNYIIRQQNTHYVIMSHNNPLKFPIPRYIMRKFQYLYDYKTNIINFNNGKNISTSTNIREYSKLLTAETILTKRPRYSSSFLSLCKRRITDYREKERGIYSYLITKYISLLKQKYQEKGIEKISARIRLCTSQQYEYTTIYRRMSLYLYFVAKWLMDRRCSKKFIITGDKTKNITEKFGTLKQNILDLHCVLVSDFINVYKNAKITAEQDSIESYNRAYVHCKSHGIEQFNL